MIDTTDARWERYHAFCLRWLVDEDFEPLDIQPHQKPWFYHVEENEYALLEAPREHGKSTFDNSYLLWRICEDTNLRILIASHIEELADDFSRYIQSHLERPELQREYGFEKGKPWTIGESFFKSKEGYVYGHPFMTTVAKMSGMTGKRFDIIIMDDLLTVTNVETEKNRRKMKKWINKAVFPALDHKKKSRIKAGKKSKRKWIVIGTRKHLDDWYSELEQMPHWTLLRDQLHTVDEETGKKTYLWPDKFDEEAEAILRAQMSASEFSMEYMNVPIPEEGNYFKEIWVSLYYYDDWEAEVPERFREIYMGIDPTMGVEGENASHFGLAVICFDTRPERQDIYVVDLVRERMSMPDQEELIIKKFKQWDPIHINMEGDLVNRQFTAQVRKKIPRIRPVFYTYRGKTTGLKGTAEISKKKRINQVIGGLFKAGKVRFRDPKYDRKTRDFMNYEYLQFPEGNLDLMDALNMAVDLVDFRKQITSDPLQWLQ